MSLTSTSVCCVHSNVYGLDNIQWIRYLTVVDPILSTSSAAQTYPHLTPGSVEIPSSTTAKNSSFIGKEPVPSRHAFTGIRMSATGSEVSHTEQGVIISFTNVLEGHTTVVVVCFISEWEPHISYTWEGRETIVRMLKLASHLQFTVEQTAPTCCCWCCCRCF